MADLTITASSVQYGSTANIRSGVAGEAIEAGQPVYQDTAGLIWQADADDTEAKAAAVGIAINTAEAANQRVAYAIEDSDFTPGATLTAGEAYALSATKGGICPIADLVTDDYITFLGVAKDTSKLYLKPLVTGGQHA